MKLLPLEDKDAQTMLFMECSKDHRCLSSQNIREFDVSPPYSASETASLLSKAKSISLHIGRLIDQ